LSIRAMGLRGSSSAASPDATTPRLSIESINWQWPWCWCNCACTVDTHSFLLLWRVYVTYVGCGEQGCFIYRHIGNAVVSRVSGRASRFGWKTWHNVEVGIITLVRVVQPSQSNSVLSSSIITSKLYIITIWSLLSSIYS
jgi:hypothetical protein